jgi:DNA-binding NarL/FixJ family response regulator
MNTGSKVLLVAHHDAVVSAGLEAIFRVHPEFKVMVGNSLSVARSVDVVIADFDNGIRISVAETGRAPPVVIVASEDGEASIRQALAAGIRGYWLPGAPVQAVVDSVRVAIRGGLSIDPRASAKMLDRWNDEPLTKREVAVLGLLVRGLSDKEMASRLGCATGTIKCHLKQVRQKLKAKSRTHAIFIAQRRGLLPRDNSWRTDVPSTPADRPNLGRHDRPATFSSSVRSVSGTFRS